MGRVHVRGLAKAFHGVAGETVEVLRAVSFEIPSPAVVGVLGPNGVGKSVLLRLLAGLLPPDAGTVTLNGKPPTACPVGFVPASTPVFGWRRAIDDMAIGLEQRGIPRHVRHAYVVEFLRHFSMDLPLYRRTYGFSAGQRQLTNIVRALAGPAPPDLVVLDEPWAALSPPVREDLLRCLDAVRQHPNVIVFLAAHSVYDALRVCDWILPFKARPVTLGPDEVIGIDLARPRGRDMVTHPALEAVRTRLAAVYATLPHGLP